MFDERLGELVPLRDEAAERAILGAILQAPSVLADVLDEVTGSDFYEPAHEVLFNTLVSMFADGSKIDPLLVWAELQRSGAGKNITPVFLTDLLAASGVPANAVAYAARVHDLAVRRRLGDAGLMITQRAGSGRGDLDELRDAAETALFEAISDKSESEGMDAAGLVALAYEQAKAIETSDGVVGVGTGLIDLDEITHGFRPGQMIILAARPSVGKSALALTIARHAAITQHVPTLMFSLEMNNEETSFRLIAAEGSIPLDKIMNGTLTQSQWGMFAETMTHLESMPLLVNDSTGISMTAIRSAVRRYAMRHPLGLVIIDYLQLLTSTGKRQENRQVEVAEFSRQVKLLARELSIPVVCCAQLNRNSENRADKEPGLADLRESGALEQDADIVILLQRPVSAERENRRGEIDLIVAKNRNGRIGKVSVIFQGHFSRFVNFAPE